jgi:hypothetical protein
VTAYGPATDEKLKLVRELRALGATRIKVTPDGELDVQFAPAKSEVTGPAVVARIPRDVEKAPEGGDKRQAWRDTVRDKLANG